MINFRGILNHLKKLFQKNINKMSEIDQLSKIRNKPVIIILGCTGTGKTKLSIELAKKYKGEIINADALQLYKGLDIATNKATSDEMSNIPHNLIAYLDPMNKNYTVKDYQKKAIELIDDLLSQNKLPIIVGGTNYYIESLLWDILIEDPDDNTNQSKKRKENITNDSFYEENKDEINNLYDSKLSNEEMLKQLEIVDAQSALKIHPNDRRKLSRALEIYYQHGVNKSDLIKAKNEKTGSGLYHGPLRYTNSCIFFLNCDNDILNRRLDERVDDMIKKGLVDELRSFSKEIEMKSEGKSIADYSEQFQVGIFQAIGFKEFDEYLKSDNDEKLFDKGVDEMKQVTRKYAKKQQRWIFNRMVKRSNEHTPDVYELNTNDLEKWIENVFETADEIFESFLEKRPSKHKPLEKAMKDEIIFENNNCNICNRVFITKKQWNDHINGNGHKKKIENLKNVDKINEYKAKRKLLKNQQELKPSDN